MLISGVNREVRRQELRELTPGSNRLFNCCVDLGFEAEDTNGNAQEIAAWARAKGYDSLIVVTSDYHMPRSLLEIRSAAPELELTPYAVSTPVAGQLALVAGGRHGAADDAGVCQISRRPGPRERCTGSPATTSGRARARAPTEEAAPA